MLKKVKHAVLLTYYTGGLVPKDLLKTLTSIFERGKEGPQL